MNITDRIRRQAQLKPNALAVVRPDGSHVSYAELERTIDFLASRVQALGLRPGNVAALILSRPYRQLCFMLALARVGVGSVSPSMPADDLAPHVDVWFTEEEGSFGEGRKVVQIERLWPQGALGAKDVPVVPSCEDGAAICGVFPTSGTTGTRRFVALSHDSLADRLARRMSPSATTEELRQICTIGPGTGYGFMHRLSVLWQGGAVVMTVRPEKILAAIAGHGVTHLAMAPISLHQLVSQVPAHAGPLPSLRQIEVGGAHLPQRLYALARDRLCANIVSQYGTAETGPVAGAPMTSLLDVPGAVGYVHPGVEVQAVDVDDVALPAGSEGALRIRSAGGATSYLGQPEASARSFKDGWFYSGDIGTVTPKGLLIIAGRASEIINQGGDKVSPHMVEEAILSFNGIKDAAAFALPDDTGVTRLWVAIVPAGAVDLAAISAHCRDRLRLGALPSILKLRALPRNDAGKVLRDDLRRIAIAARAKRREAAKNIKQNT
jgi:acyl-CoA synthetase (AMP-forming)/AMP-acid ligase II